MLIIAIVMISGIIWYKNGQKTTEKNQETIIEIQSGTNTTNILALLKENNIIKNDFIAKISISGK